MHLARDGADVHGLSRLNVGLGMLKQTKEDSFPPKALSPLPHKEFSRKAVGKQGMPLADMVWQQLHNPVRLRCSFGVLSENSWSH